MGSIMLRAAQLKNAGTAFVWEQIRRRRLATYLRSDRRPWGTGYYEYRDQYLEQVINDDKLLRDLRKAQPLPSGYGYRLDARVVEIPWLLARMRECAGFFLDAGSALNHRFILRSPALADKKITIVTLAPEGQAFWQLGVSYVFGDLRNLDFRDERFDAIACISTIEHVGMDNSMYAGKSDIARRSNPSEFLIAVRELKRTLKPDGVLYVTFPFGRYENHGWFQQFDAPLLDTLVNEFNPRQFAESIFRYDPDGWKFADRTSCAACEYFDVHTSKYIDPNSTIEYPPDYPAAERALACLELHK